MLQNIREKTSGWIAYLIIGLISIPFVLAGITSYFGGGGDLAPAAVVDGEKISSRQLDYAYANYQQHLKSLFGGEIPEAYGNEATLKEQVRDQLIEEQVLMMHVQDENFRLGDQALNQKITSMSIFQEDGRFNMELYQGQLQSQGISPQQFEEDLRRSEEMLQIKRAINATSIKSTVRANEKQLLDAQERKISSLLLAIETDAVLISDEDLEKEYKANSKAYMTKEMLKVDYIELNIETLKTGIALTEDEIRAYYEQVKEELITLESRQTSHILLQLDEDANEQLVEEKRQLAISLKEKLNAGESFAALAKEHSQDPASANEGGDLGDVEKGAMVEPFEKALFALDVGDISDPIRTTFGWHIIQLNNKSGGEAPTYAAKKLELSEQLKSEKAESKIYELSESLANLTYEQPDSLAPAAEQLELLVKTSDWFQRNQGEGIAANAKVRDLAFSTSVLSEGRNSEMLELSDNNLLVIHLNEHKPSALPPLSDIKDTLVKSLKVQKARLATAKQGKEGLATAKANGLAAVALDWKQSVKDNGFIKRSSTADQRDIINLAFRMNKPNGVSSYQGIELSTGDYAIVEVSDVRVDESAPKLDDAKRSGAETYEYQAWLKHKVNAAEVMRTPLAKLQ